METTIFPIPCVSILCDRTRKHHAVGGQSPAGCWRRHSNGCWPAPKPAKHQPSSHKTSALSTWRIPAHPKARGRRQRWRWQIAVRLKRSVCAAQLTHPTPPGCHAATVGAGGKGRDAWHRPPRPPRRPGGAHALGVIQRLKWFENLPRQPCRSALTAVFIVGGAKVCGVGATHMHAGNGAKTGVGAAVVCWRSKWRNRHAANRQRAWHSCVRHNGSTHVHSTVIAARCARTADLWGSSMGNDHLLPGRQGG